MRLNDTPRPATCEATDDRGDESMRVRRAASRKSRVFGQKLGLLERGELVLQLRAEEGHRMRWLDTFRAFAKENALLGQRKRVTQ